MDYLKNLKVVELASVLAGPAAGMFFAELGAKVIKIENKKTGGDVTRSWKLPDEDPSSNVSAYFSAVNYKKEYLFLDYTNANDITALHELLRNADVVIANFKAGDDVKFKLDYPSVKVLNENIIYAHLTGYGKENPKVAYDVVLQAEAGFLYMNGTATSGPVKMPVALIDVLAAHQLKEAVLLALLKKNTTGKGSYIELSLLQTAISSLANQATNYLMENHIPQPMGTLHPNIAPYGEIIYSKEKIPFVLAVGSDQQFKLLCNVIGASELLSDQRFSDNKSRVKNRMALIGLLNEFSSCMETALIENKLNENNVPFGKINSMKDVFEMKEAKEMIREETIEGTSTKRVSTIAFKLDFLND